MFKKSLAIISALVMGLSFASCDAVDEFIDTDSNIGKNKPALGTASGDVTVTIATTVETEAEIEEIDPVAQEVAELLSSMTSEEKLAQMILARYPDNAVEVMSEYQFGGYTMYATDFEYGTTESIKATTDEIKRAAKITPFLAVDEEGGSVVRISCYSQYISESFSSPQVLYQRGGVDMLVMDATEKAELLKSLGLNLNLGPVCDITDDTTSYIYSRTLGLDAETTATCISAMIEATNSIGVASCLKHFPGYGSSADTHTGTATDDRTLSEIMENDMLPFYSGTTVSDTMQAAVMISHNIYTQIDDTLPASLSPEIYSLLRNQLGFNGVAITDDLSMDAVAAYSSDTPATVQALLAGADMLCVSDYESAFSELKSAYADGILTDDIINEHVTRILTMKVQYGITEDRPEEIIEEEETEEEIDEVEE